MSKHRIAVPDRQPQQLRLPGFRVPGTYSARRQALRRGVAATPVVAEPTAAELEQAGQMTLPFPQNPVPEISPLVNEMVNSGIPRGNIQDYVDDFQTAIDNNDIAEQDNIIAEMEGIVTSLDTPTEGVATTFTKEVKMPFKSEAQKKWLYANKPNLAAKFEEETPAEPKLPQRMRLKESIRKATNRQTEANYKRRTKRDSGS